MIKLNREELKDKITACWLGKNIGGTLAGPYEGRQEMLNVEGFITEPGNPLPNDDLDLQMVWLRALEENGPQNVTPLLLGEYWIEYIPPYWYEYGIGKNNMIRGIVPPISGHFKNNWKHSNGAFIRTEIWATLFPGLVEEAIKYAYYDACVDHGRGEGTYAAIFVAALESAAFLVSDLRELINIGLSKIPEDCRMSKHIRAACDAYDSGKTWQEARNIVTDMSLADPELGWFQAPANVSYSIIGLLYGEGDFKKSLLITTNCGDDTDCSCATAGSILGIMNGTKIIPDDWKEFVGDKIVSVAINLGALTFVPKTCTELSERVIKQHNVTLLGKNIELVDTQTELPDEDRKNFSGMAFVDDLNKHSPYGFNMEFNLSKVWIDYEKEPMLKPGEQIKITVSLKRKLISYKHFEYRFILPEGWSVSDEYKSTELNKGIDVKEYVITAGDKVEATNRLILEISSFGHPEVALVPLLILG